jgi:predicted extracellular nuclease
VVVGDMGDHAGVFSSRGALVLQADDYNPERIVLDDRLAETPFVGIGDYSEDPIIGVVDFEYGNFKILPDYEIAFVSGGLAQEEPIAPAEEGQLRVLNYNVLNLAAPDTERIQVLAEQVVDLFASPDILCLQELQDNNGAPNMDGVAADQTYQAIIDAILASGGPEYGYLNIDPKPEHDGGEPGGNIRVGFLYRLDSGLTLVDAPQGDAVTAVEIIEVDGSPVLSLNPGRIGPDNKAFDSSRKPLAVQFNYQGESLFLINNHFISKSGDNPLFGEVQPPVFESEEIRNQQAQVVHDFVAELLSVDPEARVIVMGDLNEFQFAQPIEILAGDILNDLIFTLPVEEQYTYVYDGNSEVLDHMMVSDTLFDSLVSFDILHINSEYDYASQFSDHDVLIATFDYE